MFKFFYFFTSIYTSTNNGSISTTEFVVSNVNDFYSTKNKNQCTQISNGNNNTKQFLEKEDFELEKIIENALDLEDDLQHKNTQSSDFNNSIFNTMKFQCFQDNDNVTNNETFENPVRKKLKLDDNNKYLASENARHRQDNFQNNASIYDSSSSNSLDSQNQYDTVLNFDKAINDQSEDKNDAIKCKEIVRYKDKAGLLNHFYNVCVKKLNIYLISRNILNHKIVSYGKIVQSNNQQLTNLDLFMDFCKEVLGQLKSAFDKIKEEPISIKKEIFYFKSKDKKIISKLAKLKRCYFDRRRNLNTSIKFQIKEIEESSFFKKSLCKPIKKLIVECNMFIKEIVEYFLSFNLTVNLQRENINLAFYECENMTQRFKIFSQTIQLECVVVIIKMLIERLECSQNLLVKMSRNLHMFFNSVAHLSTDIEWLISPLKNIMDGIDKNYEHIKLN